MTVMTYFYVFEKFVSSSETESLHFHIISFIGRRSVSDWFALIIAFIIFELYKNEYKYKECIKCIKNMIDKVNFEVRFADNKIWVYEDEKINNFNEEYRKNRENNVRLARMERYFRKMHLLERHEMLSFSNLPQHHLRVEYIDQIAYDRGWVDRHEYIHILAK